jgi:hypothetical protein
MPGETKTSCRGKWAIRSRSQQKTAAAAQTAQRDTWGWAKQRADRRSITKAMKGCKMDGKALPWTHSTSCPLQLRTLNLWTGCIVVAAGAERASCCIALPRCCQKLFAAVFDPVCDQDEGRGNCRCQREDKTMLSLRVPAQNYAWGRPAALSEVCAWCLLASGCHTRSRADRTLLCRLPS